MITWKHKFDQSTLERGKTSLYNNRVADLKEDKGIYTAVVYGAKRSEVSLKIQDNELKWMRCSCPTSKSGRGCEHIAAVLYAIEVRQKAKEQQTEERDGAGAAETSLGRSASGKSQI